MTVAEHASTLCQNVRTGNRRALAQVLSLIESSASTDQPLLDEVRAQLSANGNSSTLSRRIAVSGSPGVGKSTLLEVLGLSLLRQGHRVAVLAVDPSSRRTGGSIMGDKVRMPQLSVHPDAFVRPSASRMSLGGTTSTMRDSILACEHAGFDVVIVETVGVGQNEVAAADMVDLFLLLVLPNSGDDLQGIKRGIMEVADVVAVTKADIDAAAAHRTAAMYTSALRLMVPPRQQWQSAVVLTSAVSEAGVQDLMKLINDFFDHVRHPAIVSERRRQRLVWFKECLEYAILNRLLASDAVRNELDTMRTLVADGIQHPAVAAASIANRITINNQGAMDEATH